MPLPLLLSGCNYSDDKGTLSLIYTFFPFSRWLIWHFRRAYDLWVQTLERKEDCFSLLFDTATGTVAWVNFLCSTSLAVCVCHAFVRTKVNWACHSSMVPRLRARERANKSYYSLHLISRLHLCSRKAFESASSTEWMETKLIFGCIKRLRNNCVSWKRQ